MSKLKKKPKEDYYTLTRENLNDREKFREKIEEFLGLEFIKDGQANEAPIIEINWSRIRDIAKFMKLASYRLDDIFATDTISHFELNYLYSCKSYRKNSFIIFLTKLNKSVKPPSLSDVFTRAKSIEKEITKRMGIQFKSYEKPDDTDSEQHLCKPAEIQPMVTSDSPFPYGVYHPIHEEYSYIETYEEKDIIKGVELRDGWLYKQIQPQLEHINPFTGYRTILEQISEYNNVALNLAFFNNLEALQQKSLPNKAKYIRTLLAEIERILHHLVWFINLTDIIGNKKKQQEMYNFYLTITDYVNKTFYNPKLYNTVRYGTAQDIQLKSARNFWKYLKNSGEKVFNTCYDFTYDKFTRDMLSGLAVVSKKEALDFGLSGPSLRASGVPIDVRASDPYLIYNRGEISQMWNVIAFKQGDCFARVQVRLWEIRESLLIAKTILKSLAIYERKLNPEKVSDDIKFEENNFGFCSVESPSGEIRVYMRTALKSKSSNLYSVKISSADRANYDVMQEALLEEPSKYLPLIVHSFDINFHLVDL